MNEGPIAYNPTEREPVPLCVRCWAAAPRGARVHTPIRARYYSRVCRFREVQVSFQLGGPRANARSTTPTRSVNFLSKWLAHTRCAPGTAPQSTSSTPMAFDATDPTREALAEYRSQVQREMYFADVLGHDRDTFAPEYRSKLDSERHKSSCAVHASHKDVLKRVQGEINTQEQAEAARLPKNERGNSELSLWQQIFVYMTCSSSWRQG